MKPLYSMERNKCFSTYSVPWSRIYGVYSTPGVGLERNMCYSGVGTRLCRSCAKVVQKLCRSCAKVLKKLCPLLAPTVHCIACSHCELYCLLPLCVALLAPHLRLKFISSLFYAMWMDTWNWMSFWICKRAFKIMNFDYGMEVIVNDYPINEYIQKKIFNECDWINWIWIWLVISCSVWMLIWFPTLTWGVKFA